MNRPKEYFKKTIFLDIDGCVFEHPGSINKIINQETPRVLPGSREKLEQWEADGYRVVLTTGRKESLRKRTEEQLEKAGLVGLYDQLVMGINRGERILINDVKPGVDMKVATAVQIERNEGLENVDIG